jgi:glutathione S-transferase
MITLYYRPGACALGPHILLEWIGTPYQAINAPRDESFLAINPSGAVPALKLDDDTIITQCTAILNYLCETAGRQDLLGGSAIQARTEVWKWAAFLTGDFHPAFFPLFVPFRYTSDASEQAHAHVREAASVIVSNKLSLMENHLQGRSFFVGEGLSIVDCYAVPMLRWAGLMLPGGRSRWPSVEAFYQRMLVNAGVQAAMQVHGIDP